MNLYNVRRREERIIKLCMIFIQILQKQNKMCMIILLHIV
jgi:hypothetical protein